MRLAKSWRRRSNRHHVGGDWRDVGRRFRRGLGDCRLPPELVDETAEKAAAAEGAGEQRGRCSVREKMKMNASVTRWCSQRFVLALVLVLAVAVQTQAQDQPPTPPSEVGPRPATHRPERCIIKQTAKVVVSCVKSQDGRLALGGSLGFETCQRVRKPPASAGGYSGALKVGGQSKWRCSVREKMKMNASVTRWCSQRFVLALVLVLAVAVQTQAQDQPPTPPSGNTRHIGRRGTKP